MSKRRQGTRKDLDVFIIKKRLGGSYVAVRKGSEAEKAMKMLARYYNAPIIRENQQHGT